MASIHIAGVGQTISRLRKEHNMTQMELADLLGISFQAVSNWERGNSMPDITKLPGLAELFGVSIDELLGQTQPLIQVVLEDKVTEYVKEHEVTLQEVTEVAPILKPDQVDEVVTASRFANLGESDGLLPFLGHELILEMAEKAFDAGQSIDSLLPFLRQEDVQMFAQKALAAGRSLNEYYPFLSMSIRQETAHAIYERTHSLSSLEEIAPFLDHGWLTDFTLGLVASGQHGLGDLDAIAPFLDKQRLAELIRKAYLKAE